MRKYFDKTKMMAGFALISATSVTGHAGGFLSISIFHFEMNAEPGITFTIEEQIVWAKVVAFVGNDCCDPTVPLDYDYNTDISYVTAEAFAGSDCVSAHGFSQSELSTSSVAIVWDGFLLAEGGDDHCPQGSYGASVGAGFYVEFSTDGDFIVEPPECPTEVSGSQPGRTVTANIVCLDGPNPQIFVGSITEINDGTALACSSPIGLGAGGYSASAFSITINDAADDVTGDGRFNVEDAAFLQGIVGTAAASDSLYTDRFDYNLNGIVDQDDVDMIHKFIDTGLSSGIFGDTNKDGVVDCCDLDGYKAAFGSTFNLPGSIPNPAYIVELDWDLDGDIDAIDQAQFDAIACIADINNDYAVDVFDTFAFLALYNAGDPTVDFNGDGVVDVFDLFMFLDAYNTPCS